MFVKIGDVTFCVPDGTRVAVGIDPGVKVDSEIPVEGSGEKGMLWTYPKVDENSKNQAREWAHDENCASYDFQDILDEKRFSSNFEKQYLKERRDLFAAHALQGLLAMHDLDETSEKAVFFADEVIKILDADKEKNEKTPDNFLPVYLSGNEDDDVEWLQEIIAESKLLTEGYQKEMLARNIVLALYATREPKVNNA